MKKFNLFYSVENGGDGSAYPIFFATAKEAEDHQNELEEGWGESCTGMVSITVNDEGQVFADGILLE